MACLAFSVPSSDGKCHMGVAGLWNFTLAVFTVPALQPVVTENIGSEVIPRSLCVATLGESQHLLAGLGDGQLLSFHFDLDFH